VAAAVAAATDEWVEASWPDPAEGRTALV
jgi:hypothetical protein